MSFNQKTTIFSVVLIILLPVAAFLYFKKDKPKPVPLPERPEINITIIPGWNLRQIADYLVEQKFASSTDDVYKVTGRPGEIYKTNDSVKNFMGIGDIWIDRPVRVSYEGYFAPETMRVFVDASIAEVLERFLSYREKQIDSDMIAAIQAKGITVHELLTMASIVEKEAKFPEDRTMVADILWRRLKIGWALQVDSSVHYAVARTGDVFTTAQEREMDSPWNTYKYPGLPPGPISNPSIATIQATLYSTPNNYWYFLSDKEGRMHYARTLEEHNENKYKYLR